MGEGNKVAAEIKFEADISATGGHISDEEVHLWTFDEQGKVIGYRGSYNLLMPLRNKFVYAND